MTTVSILATATTVVVIAIVLSAPVRAAAPTLAPPTGIEIVTPTVMGAVPDAEPPPPRPVIEVVFVLDTTGSMSGLLEGAKQNIWSIASHIASGQPTPEVHIGLVAYRDIGDAYVTKVRALSDDLDKVHASLKAFRAEGGGDEPEHVWRGLSDAVNKMQWADNATKMIFLVGDAPPHDDYGDGFTRAKVLAQAGKKQIVIHAIRAGSTPETARVWTALAQSAGGAYASIDQGGGWRSTKTPMDERLAALSRDLDKTVIGYGDANAHARLADRSARGIGSSAMDADRGSFLASTGAKVDANDILDDLVTGKRDVTDLDAAKLPTAMRTMSIDERRAFVASQKARRETILKEMKELTAQRNAHLKTERVKASTARRAPSMDDVVNRAVESQAAAAGVAY